MSRIPPHKPPGNKTGGGRSNISGLPKGDERKSPSGIQTRGTVRAPSLPACDPDVETDGKSNDNNTDSANIAKILTKLDTLDDRIESTKINLSERIEGSNA